jgi:hypothetical protein
VKCEFWRRALETSTVEGEVIRLGDLLIAKRSGSVIHRRFFCNDFRVLNEIVPLNGVQMLQVRDWAKKEIRRSASPSFGRNSPLGDEERWRPQTTSAVGCVNLMAKELLNVIDVQEMLAIRRNDDRVPDL